MMYYGIWVVRNDGDSGWLTINNLVFWAPDITIAWAQLKDVEINGSPEEHYQIVMFNPSMPVSHDVYGYNTDSTT